MTDRAIVATDQAAAAVGPYSQAITAGGVIYTSGQLPIDTEGNIPDGIEAQTRLALVNLTAVLTAGGSAVERVVRVGVYLKDMNDFGAMNAIYAEVFGKVLPARTTVEVARLPRDARVEIECIATIG